MIQYIIYNIWRSTLSYNRADTQSEVICISRYTMTHHVYQNQSYLRLFKSYMCVASCIYYIVPCIVFEVYIYWIVVSIWFWRSHSVSFITLKQSRMKCNHSLHGVINDMLKSHIQILCWVKLNLKYIFLKSNRKYKEILISYQ